jgi:hypothetical protein
VDGDQFGAARHVNLFETEELRQRCGWVFIRSFSGFVNHGPRSDDWQ